METVTARKKKTGRPVKAAKKERRASVRFTRAEYFIVKEKAIQAGLNTSAYLRAVAIQAQVTSRLTPEQMQLLRRLVGMDNNLNQIAKSCHQEGAFRTMIYFQQYRSEMDFLLKKLKP